MFAERLAQCATALSHGRNVVWGAGGKGGAFVCALDPDSRLIEALVDINPEKQGRFLAMTRHRIVGPEDIDWSPDITLWIMNETYEDEIMASIPRFAGKVIVL